MRINMQKNELRILATLCHTATCCPTVIESQNSDEIIIVGDAVSALLASPIVTAKIGQSEAAVVIPKDLLLEAMRVLRS
jgi:hypothetical protein